MSNPSFDKKYYESNSQNDDRPALIWYARLINRISPLGLVLDFGAGTGHLCKRLKANNVAFETNDYAIGSIKRNSPSTNVFSSFEKLNSYDVRFSCIVSIHTIEHMTDSQLRAFFKMAHCKLSDEGTLLLATPSLNGIAHSLKGESWSAFKDPTHINLKNVHEWIVFFEDNGFIVTDMYADGFYDFPYLKWFSLKHFAFTLMTLANLFSYRPFLSPYFGENTIFILKKLQSTRS